jgi:DnaJ-class molecular chaperone
MAASDTSDGSDAERGQNEQLLYSSFKTTNIYKILGVGADCEPVGIKKAYRKKALEFVR